MIDRIAPLGNGQVRMAYLATIGSHAVNGVAPLHSELLKKDVLHDLFQIFPERSTTKRMASRRGAGFKSVIGHWHICWTRKSVRHGGKIH
ncbi:hypothetical protein CHT97_04745 [Lacticaseibacillus chiayiensis]|nr:hypothetical protein CHT97_04745 [Lacticaseibacillus chiayiensis]